MNFINAAATMPVPMNNAHPKFPVQVPTPADDLLIEALRDCSRRSTLPLQRLHALTAPRLLGVLVQMLDDRSQAEAALLQCYLRIYEQAASFNPQRCTPGAWLLGVARREALTLRHANRAPPDPPAAQGALRLADAALQEGHAPQERWQHDKLAVLDADARRCLRLAWLSGQSPGEIASALEWPVQRVRTALHQGLAALGDLPLAQCLAGSYVLGTQTELARARFARRLHNDAALRRKCQRWDEILAALAPELPAVRPEDNAWSRVAAQLQRDTHAPARRGRLLWVWLAALLAAVALAVIWPRLQR